MRTMPPLYILPLAALLVVGACASAQHADTQPPAETSDQAMAAYKQLDQRTPVPLKPMMAWHQKQNMMGHLVTIERIVDGVAAENWEQVAKAAAEIGSSPKMKKMCMMMGKGAAGFGQMGLEFHRRADLIGEAAKTQDSKAVLRATASTLQACASCHAAYRQEIVSPSAWGASAAVN